MLKNLHVSNYALIEELDIAFEDGFTAITGETGAGKSILIGALGLALGNRADVAVLMDKTQKCVVEAVFNVEDLGVAEWFQQNELDYQHECFLRREINTAGKSRAFINDTPVNLTTLKELGEQLIDIHSQHESLHLGESTFQLRLVDGMAANHLMLENYQLCYAEYQSTLALLNELNARKAKLDTEKAFIQFQFDEIHGAGLSSEEYDLLRERLEILNHAEEIAQGLFSANEALNRAENNVLGQIAEAANALRRIKGYMPAVLALFERIDVCSIELRDVARELDQLEEKAGFDPEEMERTNNRLGIYAHLMQKHRLQSVDQLLELQQSLDLQLSASTDIDNQIARYESQLKVLQQDIKLHAERLNASRKAVVPYMSEQMEELLKQVGMPNARFEVLVEPLQQYGPDGKDRVRFLFSANKGIAPDDISKMASGGELSRLMLAVKSLLSEKKLLPTIIFDEIDTGISGDIAAKVGRIMAAMAKGKQVISITHLPQIAGKAHQHLYVYKTDDELKTKSMIVRLDQVRRVEEIARMLSDDAPTTASLNAAKELIAGI